MGNKVVLVSQGSINRHFSERVAKLHGEGKQLVAASNKLTEYMLGFAKKVQALWVEAKEIDREENGAHRTYLREQLAEIIGTKDPSVLSKWVTIGKQVPVLLPYKDSLPPQREVLHQIAVTAKKNGEKTIQRLVKEGKLSPDSTVRDVSSALSSRRGKKPAAAQRYVSVTLTFSTNYRTTATELLSLIANDSVLNVRAHSGLREAVKSALGERYALVEKKFT